ncbi:MAG: right-handed parallel beta-helix repeat-containing protein, partial [Acidobacteria bacterium]|nr:right-handed parallel beta-helix repeat-containing protein [Acidobacteriota bacterium]
VVLNATGSFTYTPAVGDSATTDSFQYVLTDDGAPLPASDTATVTIHRFERVWYVDNSSAAGGLGRSNDPFDTLLEAQTASSANDWIFVHFGNGTTTGQAGGITLKAGQRLIGEHVGLTLPVSLNGGGPSSTLFPAVPGNRPLLDDTVAGAPEGVAATDAIPAEIAGLSLAGNVNGIDLTTNAAFAGSGTLAIHDNVVRSSGAEGIDVQHAGSGALRLDIHANSVTAGTNGIDLLRSGGSLTVQRFDDNVIGGNTGGSGIVVSGAVFDAAPGLPINTVDGGATVIGQSGDGVGTHGLLLMNVTGDLAFTDLDVWNDGGTGLLVSSTGALNAGAGTGFRVTVPAGVATVDANGGPAVDVNNASVTLPLGFLESTNSPTTGLSLVNAFGGAGLTALSASAGQISDPVGASGTAVFVSGGTGNVSLGIPVTNTAGNSVAVTGRSADTVSFTSAVSDTGSGVSLTSNTGGTISFRGGLSASTGANPAFAATGGGLVEVCDENPCSAGATGPLVNSLTTTTGVALNVANTTITANELEFRSISAGTAGSGPANGVVLNNTGALGALRVKGTGSAGSGGTLQKTTGDGISLVATRPPSFSFVNVSNTGSHGIEVNGVAGLTLTGCQITNAGDGDNEHGLRLLNTSGTVAINSTTFNNAAEDLINVDNTNTNLTLNVGSSSQLSFPATLGTFAGNGILMVGRGSSALTVNVSGNSISNVKLAALQVGGDGTSTGTHNITVANNTMTVGIAGRSNNVNVQARNTSTVTLSITGNAMNGVGGGPINIGADDSSQVNATVSGNNMIANSPSAGILAANDNGSRLRILISGNQITNVGGDGIEIANFGGVGVSELDAIVTNNTVNGHSTNPASFFLGGIVIFGFEDSTCVVLTGNNVQGTPSPGTFFDYSLEELGGTMILEEVPNTAATTANAAYVLSTNTGGSSTVDIVGTIDLSNGATVCDRP